jgi:hypothetical protein
LVHKRYDDVFAPAVEKAGLTPYRVDRDPGTTIPIEDIEAGIAGCQIAFADISTDNPNVWFELGYAIARQKDVILVCSDERTTPFPFDVQHRTVIKYKTESSSDFDELGAKVVSRIEGILSRREKLGEVVQLRAGASVEGLKQHEIAVLVSLAEEAPSLHEGLSTFRIRQAMEGSGFMGVAAMLGIDALAQKSMLESYEGRDYDGNDFLAYRITQRGLAWLHTNVDKLELRRPPPSDELPF